MYWIKDLTIIEERKGTEKSENEVVEVKKIGFKTLIGEGAGDISLPTGYFVSADISIDLTAARVCFCGEEIGWPKWRNTCRRATLNTASQI